MKRAWMTIALGIKSITATETRGQAIARTLRSARECGYQIQWTQIRARRRPEYDDWAEVDESKGLWDEALLPKGP